MEDSAGAAGRIPAGTLFDGLEDWTPEEAALSHYGVDAATRAAWSQLETWQGYTPDTSDAEARAKFAARYSCEPRELRRSQGAVLAGPIPAGGAR